MNKIFFWGNINKILFRAFQANIYEITIFVPP